MFNINFRNKNLFKKNVHIHFIGIGGIGMSGIAEILLKLDYIVSGSDVYENQNTLKLKELGAKIAIGHKEENIEGATVVVFSSIIRECNPEVVAAKAKDIPIIQRAELLSELMRLKFGLAVAGTHGKTTTTSFLATILNEANLDATYIIGGIVDNLGGHAKVGNGEVLVAEVDESDGSFLLLNPIMSIINNIDDDHLDYYQNNENLIQAFVDFANKVPFYGCVSLNIHDEILSKIRDRIKRPHISFGIESMLKGKGKGKGKGKAENVTIPTYMAKNVQLTENGSEYELYYKEEFATKINIFPMGTHNVLNSLGAISLAHQLGLTFDEIAEGISKFKGVRRRLESLYKYNLIEIIDDYAHHPTAAVNSISALRKTKEGKLVIIFEPHRYNRTFNCWKDFMHCFNEADELHILPIYAASEDPIPGITSNRLVEDINKLHPGLAVYAESFAEIDKLVQERIKKNEKTVFATLGAGAIGKNIRLLVKSLKA
ncbi:MAG: UDP-N-acetylmuramate--L-alanine ligase [Oligoflexia bacterium]|nr:UDP-N-acetylmuramate--L-alanine ligase [Oligoflexia bacterium]